jgi:nitroreductase
MKWGGILMEIFEAIRGRRSVRAFSEKHVPNDTLSEVIEAAGWAPSAHNQQPWEIIITRDKIKQAQLAEGHRFARFLPNADVVIAVCCELKMRKTDSEEPGLQYFEVQDTAAAIQNLLLAAHGKGLGTCWVGDFSEESVKEIFEIPNHYCVMALIALGYPAQVEREGPDRRPMSEWVHWEKF